MLGDDDLDACFSTDDFGTEGVFSDSGGEVARTNGHFTEGSDATVMYGVEIEAVEPSFTCRSDAVTAVSRDDTAVIDGRTFTVERKQKVGTGVSVIYLKT